MKHARIRNRMLALTLLGGCALGVVMIAPAGCSLGQGTGDVKSDALYVKDCVLPTKNAICSFEAPPDAGVAGGGGSGGATGSGVQGIDQGCDNYDLRPDFFAAIPSENTIQIRIQRGTDLTELSDGLAVVVHNVKEIRDALQAKRDAAEAAGATEDEALESQFVDVPVALPAGVKTPGSTQPPPVTCDKDTQLCDVTPVAMALYLQKSCHNQNTVLYAVSGFVRFNSLFSGDPIEPTAAKKLTYASHFDVIVGDPRDADPDKPIPTDRTSKLTGNFRFYFERGKPAQPF